ncbi:hypothetical protein L596_020139 [Steinernema carpocapsae]|uniref:Uncharacterized protein n=1 Tax=Steinernema carpocapsae TaxID=34508 RepID=A0A4U5MTG4_STECR|nr:hypothetical protein L596_020139 [Steinernema carpocapsae]
MKKWILTIQSILAEQTISLLDERLVLFRASHPTWPSHSLLHSRFPSINPHLPLSKLCNYVSAYATSPLHNPISEL